MIKEIGIIGDFHNSKTQSTIAGSIEHSNKAIGIKLSYQWIDSLSLEDECYVDILKNLSGIWSAPGSPFKSLNGALNAIKYARENNVSHLGTCSGYQHTIIEYSRNVLGLKNAQHEEYSSGKDNLFIHKMTCSIAETKDKVILLDNTLAKEIYKINEIEGSYFCRYGLNDEYRSSIIKGDLIISGIDKQNAIRIIELRKHPFFISTVFVPQNDSSYEKPNPIITEFIKSANKN